ncbi:Pentatricopeptide repeat-containing protein [Seminavis robusta]|uniref:Pentatricopeptide repeat-containing protein n=1 Tax=Seminavis robusta TaxID=568900 RepID=A0A9N8ED32_9STRA|nr:Pentatricopeptide repeat-containing protein [Seminavis robusta]|eukprot:Sro972_g226550.1 Pentatricopeptide repeat-containing protein (826) ;mRNA; r:3879-6998
MVSSSRMLGLSFGLIVANVATLSAFIPQQNLFLSRRSGQKLAYEINATATSGSSEGLANEARTVVKAFNEPPVKIQSRLEEIQQTIERGENLTQDYCDTTLGLCVAAEQWECVIDVLEQMQKQQMTQERSTFRMCLQQCFEVGNGASALEILQAMEQALIEPQPDDIGLVAAAMCRNNRKESGWWKRALDLLLKNPSPDVPIDAYDAVLACLVDERNWKESIKLLRRLEQPPKNKKRMLPKPTLATYREVIECCVAGNQVEQGVQILDKMKKRGIKPTVYTFEIVISGLARKLQWRRALQLLDTMDEYGVNKTVPIYNTLISACARGKEIGVAKSLLARMKKEGIWPSIITYNSLISSCASAGRWKDAMNLFDQCNRDPHVEPDIYTYTNVIRACSKGKMTERAFTLHDTVLEKNIPLDSYFYAAVIEVAANARQWKRALELLDEMEEKGVPPSDVVYSLTIKACGNGGKWQSALNLLEKMRSKGMRINLITYNAAIAALAKAAKRSAKYPTGRPWRPQEPDSGKICFWVRAIELLDQMKKDNIKPDGFSFSSAISCCGAEGRWQEALALIDLMKKGGPRTQPNRVAFTAAIDACGRSGEHMHALWLFRNMTNNGISADRVAWNTLFHGFRVANKPDLAYELWGEMRKAANTTDRITAMPDHQKPTPDIITVTDVIATLAKSENQVDQDRVDEVFAEAVNRGIIFGSHLDSVWEVDLSGLSLPVARAACRFVVNRTRQKVEDEGEDVKDLHFITGVGAAFGQGQGRKGHASTTADKSSKSQSLRDYVQKEVLLGDLNIKSTIPKLAQGTVTIEREVLAKWIERRQ